MAFVVVTSLLQIVDQHLLHPKPSFNNILEDDIQLVFLLSDKLRFVQHFLETQSVNESLDAEIRGVAVEAEAEIESKLGEVYLVSSNQDEACGGLHQTLQKVVNDFQALEVRIQIEKKNRSVKDPSQSHGSSPAEALKLENIVAAGGSTHHHDLEPENQMVGCDDEFRKIKNMIIGQQSSEELEVIPITGMGGIGKTTLAKRVYEDPDIKSNFDIRAWAVVSQELDVKRVLISLLACIVSNTNELYIKEHGQLAVELRKRLLGQRYLIVIDDIWSVKAWDAIKQCFPDNSSRSRILMTTRHKEVAEYASTSKSIHSMRFLNPDESWNLFETKVFEGKHVHNPELESIGRSIVKKCEGLPLAIVVMAGLLRALERSVEAWKDFVKNMNSLDEIDPNNKSLGLLSLSYNYLPTHLKACFLYFGVFPEDRDILVNKLINLWVAEGFLKKEEEETTSLEEVAESYLNNLINQNLVQVSQQSFDGKIKSCRLPGFLRQFCLRKAQEENMLVVSIEYFDDDLEGTEQSSQLGCHRWMSCQSHGWPITPSTSLNYNRGKIRSILYFGKDLYLRKCRLIFPCFKLLRVLDLSLIKYWNGMPSEIVNLIHLRYLALTTTGSLHNFQLFKLQSLQTLILSSWMEECHLQLPNDILDLPCLRHVRLDKGSSLDLPNWIQENLQTLFWLKVASWDPKSPNFTRVPNLKELGIYIEGEVSSDVLDSLAQLYRLEKLKFELGRVEHFCLPISFPPNLKKLTLCKTYLPWEEMDIIGKLRNLEVLKLKDFAFCGPVWKPSDATFHRLKFLLIAHSDLEQWNVDVDVNVFPVLECLALRCCWYLKELPSDIACISRLRLIELIDCCPSLVVSAMMIQEDSIAFDEPDRLLVRHFLTEDKLQKDESSKEESKYAI